MTVLITLHDLFWDYSGSWKPSAEEAVVQPDYRSNAQIATSKTSFVLYVFDRYLIILLSEYMYISDENITLKLI